MKNRNLREFSQIVARRAKVRFKIIFITSATPDTLLFNPRFCHLKSENTAGRLPGSFIIVIFDRSFYDQIGE
jgi:hypothetical protein